MISNFILKTGQQSVTLFMQLVLTTLIFLSENPLQKIMVFTSRPPPSLPPIWKFSDPPSPQNLESLCGGGMDTFSNYMSYKEHKIITFMKVKYPLPKVTLRNRPSFHIQKTKDICKPTSHSSSATTKWRTLSLLGGRSSGPRAWKENAKDVTEFPKN